MKNYKSIFWELGYFLTGWSHTSLHNFCCSNFKNKTIVNRNKDMRVYVTSDFKPEEEEEEEGSDIVRDDQKR